MADSAALALTALALIRRSGTSYTLAVTAITTETATPWKAKTTASTSYTVYGVRQDRVGAFGVFGAAERPQSDVKEFDGVYLIAASGLAIVPAPGDLLTADGATRRVTSVEELRPAGTAILYALHVEC